MTEKQEVPAEAGLNLAQQTFRDLTARANIPSPSENEAPPVPLIVEEEEKRKREQGRSFIDYAAATMRQDSFFPGWIASLHGPDFIPDENYNALEDEEWKRLTEGISPEYHRNFLSATSRAHADKIRADLQRKQNDLQTLADMGTAGNVGRFLYGVVEPGALLAGLASGGVGFAAKGSKLINTLKGSAAGGGAMAGVEMLRQSVNYEDDPQQTLMAGLLAAGMTAPFAYLGTRAASRQATAAARELEAVKLKQAEAEGATLTPEQQTLIKEAEEQAQLMADIENGKLSPDERELAWQKFEESVEARKAAELDAIHAAGKNADVEKATLTRQIDEVNNAPLDAPTSMQLAFRKSLEKAKSKAGVASKVAKAVARAEAGTSKKTPVGELEGQTVFWPSEYAHKIDEGIVVGENANGKLIIEDVKTKERAVIDRGDLHPDSPGYHYEPSKELLEGLDGSFQPRGALPEPQRVTTGKESTVTVVEAEAPASNSFKSGSIGAAQAEALPEYVTVFNRFVPGLDKLGIKIPIRIDLFAKLQRSKNSVIRKWGRRSIKDAIGPEGGTQERTISETKDMLARLWETKTLGRSQEIFKEVVQKRKIPLHKRGEAATEFFTNVTAVLRGDADVILANSDIGPELKKAAEHFRSAYREALKEMKKAGVKGADLVDENDFYVNRSWLRDGIKNAIRTHGEDAIAQLFARSFSNPNAYGNIAKGKAFIRAILNTEFTTHIQDAHLAPRDMAALRAELSRPDPATNRPVLSDDEIDALIDVMFEVKAGSAATDSGNISNLKFRMALDENFSMKMPNGETLKMSDLMESDARVLLSKYVNSTAGQVAWARVGIKSKADHEKYIIKAAMDEHKEHHMLDPDANSIHEDIQWMRDIYDYTTGRPMSTQVFNTASRIATALRALTRSQLLGELGLVALGEMKQTLALTSMRAMTMHSPSLRGLFKELRNGQVPDYKIARQIEEEWGFGLEYRASYARQNEITEYTYDKGLSKFEQGANKASHVVDRISGNAMVTSATRQRAAMAFIQHHMDLATGRAELTPAVRKRLAHQGIDEPAIDEVFERLRHYGELDNTNGRVESVQWERWKMEDPETYDMYHLAIERETRNAIQLADIGETMPFQHTLAGRIFTELRGFIIAAHGKNFLKNLHYRDRTSFNVYVYNAVGEAMMYALQTAINFAHDKEELQRRLTMERIASAAFNRSAALGLSNMFVGTGYWIGSGGDELFEGTTANTDNRNLLTPPSVMQVTKAYNTLKTAGGILNPFSDNIVTEREFKDAWSLLPGGNTYGARNLQDTFGSMFPKSELREIVP